MEDAMSSSEVFRRPTGRDARRTEPLPIAKIGLTPRQTRAAENIGHSTLYERLGRGEYDAIKDGKRTLITLESIERRRKAVLTKATFKPPKPRARPGQCDAGGHEQVAVRSTEAEQARERA
jgi:hypothetical protein